MTDSGNNNLPVCDSEVRDAEVIDGRTHIFTPWRRRFFAVIIALGGGALIAGSAGQICLAFRYGSAQKQAAQNQISQWKAQLSQLAGQMMNKIPINPGKEGQPKFSPALMGDVVSVAMKIASLECDLEQAQEARDHIWALLGEFLLGAGALAGAVFLWPRKPRTA